MIRRRPRSPHRAATGMVLIAVLWIVAALSIAVTGLTRSVRQEAALMGTSRNALQAAATGEAAIAIVLQQLLAGGAPLSRLQEVSVAFDGRAIPVEIMPLTGLIDINAAPPALLARLYTVAGGLPAAAAEAMAQATVMAREQRDSRGSATRFEAPEDLLQVPGFSYDLYARLAGLVTADVRGSGRVNALAAPTAVLTVLASGDAAVAERISSERLAGAEGIDTTALDASLLQAAPSRRVRMTARVGMPDGSFVDVERGVDLTPSQRDGAPWQVFQSNNRTEPAPPKP